MFSNTMMTFLLAMTLVYTASSQECIEEENNQFFSSTLGDLSWEIESETGYTAEFLEGQICGDGGYVTCISTSTEENGDGTLTLRAMRFTCSDDYTSPTFGDSAVVGTVECAAGGIIAAYATTNLDVLTDGGFEGYDSSGNDVTLAEWGGDGEGTYEQVSCESGEYLIGFEVMQSYYDGVFNLWGFRLICSSDDVCPRDIEDDDLLANSAFSDDDDSTENGGHSVYQNNMEFTMGFILFVGILRKLFNA